MCPSTRRACGQLGARLWAGWGSSSQGVLSPGPKAPGRGQQDAVSPPPSVSGMGSNVARSREDSGEADPFLPMPQDCPALWICQRLSSASALACLRRSAWPCAGIGHQSRAAPTPVPGTSCPTATTR